MTQKTTQVHLASFDEQIVLHLVGVGNKLQDLDQFFNQNHLVQGLAPERTHEWSVKLPKSV